MIDALPVVLLAMVVTGGVTVWLTFQVPAPDRLLVGAAAAGLSVALCFAAAAAAYCAARARRTDGRLRSLESGIARLVDDVVPTVARRLRDGASVDTAVAAAPMPADGVQRDILRTVAREFGVGERQRAAAMAACASAAGRVQAMATSMLADLREMEGRHSEEVLGDLLKLDHSTA
ncbi:MAG: ATP-binding protein, partial [Actinophytocola sp.]|nr:ATP-binding protein [Actinophytocola sp.]